MTGRTRIASVVFAVLLAGAAFAMPQPTKRAVTVDELMEEAADFSDRGRRDAAREVWEEVVSLHVKEPQAATALLRLAETDTDLFNALEHCEAIFTHHPDAPEAERAAAMQGEIFYLLGEYGSTVDAYSHYLLHYPRGDAVAVAQDRMITALVETGRAEEALIEWDRALERDPSRQRSVAALMQRADVLIALERWAEAADWLNKFIARYPNREQMPRAHLSAALCLEALSDWREAAVLYSALVQRWPDSVEAQLASRRLDAIRGLFTAAEAVIR